MPHHVETDISVQRFGFTSDDTGKRLTFPHAEMSKIEGRSGASAYGAADCVFDQLEGRLDTFRWKADSASIGSAWLKDDAGRIDLAMSRIEMPSGLMMTRADKGVEVLAPHVSLAELRLDVKGPFGTVKTTPSADDALRQTKLRFLDSLAGHIDLTIKVVLDLPVLGVRTLDQALEVPIKEGSLDYRALEDSLDWLEGRFIDIEPHDGRVAIRWKVPIFGKSHDLISFALDDDADKLSSFGRVPVRSLLDFRIGSGSKAEARDNDRKILQALSIDAIDVALSLLAPRSVETSTGVIMFGGEDEPGMVDLEVKGAIKDKGAGVLKGRIGSVDTTIKDVWMGPVQLTADRLTFDGLDELEVTFDGFRPASVHMHVHRVTATNLYVKLGGR